MMLSQKIGKFSGIIAIGLLLIFCLLISPGLTVFDAQSLNFFRTASASSYQNNAHQPLKPFDHIILTLTGDPATTQAVTWRSRVDDKKSVAEIAAAKASPDFVKTARQISAATSSLKIKNKYVYHHSVNFTGLDPNTLYAYRVGNGNIWSEWFQFRTAGNKAEPFSFLYFGDAQNNIFSPWTRSIRAVIMEAPKARFMIHAGDMADRQNYDREWNEWFKAGGWIFATIPSLPAVGNHEYRELKKKRRTLSDYWRPQFALPENGISGLEETNYHLDFQGARFVVLNSNEKIEPQARWLEKVLNYRSVTVTGEIYDAFDLVKEDGQNSKLINRIPVEKAASATR